MVYKQFQKAVLESLKERLGFEYHLTLTTITKNNGLTLDGICIGYKESLTAPTIYLKAFFDAYSRGKPFDLIINEMIEQYRTYQLPNPHSIETLFSKKPITDKIVYRLINKSANQTLLNDLPHLSFPDLDLSLIFCLSVERNHDHLLTTLIHKNHQKLFQLSTEDLYQAAKENTPRLFPSRIRSLQEVIKEIAGKSQDTEINEEEWSEFFNQTPLSPPMYVLTNSSGTYGAACLFYEGILKDFAACTGGDLIILPSSIHEVLIIPYSKHISYEELAETVLSINQQEVAKEDRLSNHIYHYSQSADQLTTAFTSSFPIGTANP